MVTHNCPKSPAWTVSWDRNLCHVSNRDRAWSLAPQIFKCHTVAAGSWDAAIPTKRIYVQKSIWPLRDERSSTRTNYKKKESWEKVEEILPYRWAYRSFLAKMTDREYAPSFGLTECTLLLAVEEVLPEVTHRYEKLNNEHWEKWAISPGLQGSRSTSWNSDGDWHVPGRAALNHFMLIHILAPFQNQSPLLSSTFIH